MSKTIHHPFGRENEVSLQQLLCSFCNHLYLGQWECARACISEQSALASENIVQIIEDCIHSPHNKSIGPSDDEFFNPHHLSWLCCKEYEKYLSPQTQETKKSFAVSLKQVELRLLLCELADCIKASEIKELYNYCTTSIKDKDYKHLTPFSHQCLQSLRDSLFIHPTPTHIFLSQLVELHSSDHHRHSLYSIYIHCMQKVVDDIKQSIKECSDQYDFSQGTSNKVSILFEILSLFDVPLEYCLPLKPPLETLFYDLSELVNAKASVIPSESLYSALLGRENNYLLELFYTLQRKWQRHFALLQCTIMPGVDFSEDDCYLLGLSHIANREEAWKQLLFLSLKTEKHILDIIVELSLKLIEKNEFNGLSTLLHVPELLPLCPLVLLIGWDHCQTTDQAVQLVEALYIQNQDKPVLQDVCNRLSSKADTLHRFVQYFRTLLPEESFSATCMKQMLRSGLEIEGTLYMLHKYTNIGTLSQDRLTQLICELNQPDKDAGSSVDYSDHSTHSSSHDIAIYLAFCAIKDFITSLTKSADMMHWVTSTATDNSGNTDAPGHRESPFQPIRSSSVAVSTSSTADIEDIQLRYTDAVLNHLEQVKQTLEKLYPLNYRAEILEDLFSLLFLRSDDMPNVSEGESGEEGGRDWDSSTGQNTPKVGTPLTPVQLTPAKLNEHHSNLIGSKEKVSTDLITRFIEDSQQPVDAATIAQILENTNSNETNNTEVATSIIISQESLKDGDSTECDSKFKQPHTCHLSAGSNTSSFNTSKIGFIANEYFVRDALLILKQCLEKLSTELSCTDLTSQKKSKSEYVGLQCSIGLNEVKQRVVRLTQFVSEGLWRFQLVSHQFIPFEYGKILGDVSKLENQYNSDDDEIRFSDDEDNNCIGTIKKRRKRHSDSQSGTDSHVTTDGSQSAKSSSSKKHYRRSRSQRKQRRKVGRRSYMRGVLEGKQGVVSRLLSDRNTLLTMCLRRGKVSQANQVVKLFGLEETAEEAEVLFADQFQSSVNKILSHDSRLSHHITADTPEKISSKRSVGLALGGKSLLSNIASIAAKGVASLSVANTAEHLLGLTVQPALKTDSLIHKASINHLVSDDLVPTMIVLDLACSGSTAWDSANVLLDLALKRLPSHMKSGIVTSHDKEYPHGTGVYKNSTSSGQGSALPVLKGIVGVVQSLSSLVVLSSNKPLSQSVTGLNPQGINSCLNTGVVPLDPESLKSFHNCVKELQDALTKVQSVIEDMTTGTSVITTKRPVIRIAFKHLAALFDKNIYKSGLMKYLHREATDDDSSDYNYLQSMYDYFKTLGSLVAEYQGANKDDLIQLEYFNMMSESPTKTLGKIIFHYKADPYKATLNATGLYNRFYRIENISRLQKITDSLNIELMQIVLHNTCPAVTYTPMSTQHSKATGENVKEQGFVLNVLVDEQLSRPVIAGNPGRVIALLLCKNIKALQDHLSTTTHRCYFGPRELIDCSHSHHCSKLLSQTHILTSVDLTRLHSNEEKQCFFLNLANLMLIHGALHFAKTSTTDLLSLLGETSEMEKILSERNIQYQVGQLGTVSWYDIHHCILGVKCHSMNMKQQSKDYFTRNLEQVKALDKLDPWTVFGPSYDYRMQYTAVDGQGQYYFQVYYPEILKDQLKLAEVDRKDNLSTKCAGLLLSRDSWMEMKKEVYSLRVKSHTAEYNTTTAWCQEKSSLVNTQSGSTATYKLSETVDSYLKYKSGLVATLAGLVAKSQPSEEDGSTEMSVYTKHNQLQTDFPVLHRHLQTMAMHLVSGIDKKISSVPDQLWNLMTEDLGYHFKAMFLSSAQTQQFQSMLKNVFMDLMSQQKWQQLADLVIDCPAVIGLQSYEQLQLKDLAITACVANAIAQNDEQSEQNDNNKEKTAENSDSNNKHLVWKLICNVNSTPLRVRLLLCSLVLYSEGVAVKHLLSCLHWLSGTDLLRVAVVSKIAEMQLYQKISDCAKREINRLPSRDSTPSHEPTNVQYYHNSALDLVDSTDPIYSVEFLHKLTTWKQIRETSITCSDLVLEFLLTCNQHEIARQWVEVFHYYDFTSVIEESCIFYHLQQSDPKVTEVLEILERLKENNSIECKNICFNLIPKLSQKKFSLLLVNFLKKNLQSEMTRDEVTHVYLLNISCLSFLCLPTNIHCEYDHLVANPVLLLEQLLMNMKVDLSGKVLDCIKSELNHLQRCLNPQQNGASTKSINTGGSGELLSMKPLEENPSEDRKNEVMNEKSLNQSKNQNEEFKKQPFMHQSQSTASSSSTEVINNPYLLEDLNINIAKCDALIVEYAKKALEFGIVQDLSSGRSSVMSQICSATSPTHQKHRKLSMGPSSVGSPQFRKMSKVDSFSTLNRMGALLRSTHSSVPANLDKRGSLAVGSLMGGTPDTDLGGGRGRGMFVMPAEPPGRDQWVPDSSATVCMVCGIERFSMFNRRHHCRRCGRVVCSSCSTKTLMIQGSSARACDQCYDQSHKPKQVLSSKDKAERLRQKLTSHVPGSGESTGSIVGLDMSVGDTDSILQPLSAEYQYKLSLDDEDINDLMREEFYYDHAPSTSLCLSILDLHSDPAQCSQIILDLCDTVSMYLQTSEPGVKNPEVDYGLVISMLKYLLFNAKVKSQKAQNSTGVTKCDLYLDRVNLVDILVHNNISYIPSIQQLTRMDVLRRLRDKLIASELWGVATTVSTKCGIDPLGVWVAWGKACVRVADYKQAREKFAKCLKIPSERNQPHSPSKMLSDVIECVEQSAVSSVTGEFLLNQLKSDNLLVNLLADPVTQKSIDYHQEEPYFQECVYYLKTYGTHGSLVNFYQKHRKYDKALQIILSERCSTDVLIESLLLPSLQCGELFRVQESMSNIDPSMTRWDMHLTAICRYLNTSKMMHTLYHMQLFMKDYIRAAMTCVTYFYQKEAKNYLDLHSRLLFLQDAKSHMESYIEHKMWVGSVEMMPGKHRQESASSRLILTPREVNKYIHTIDLQIEATKYLSHYIDNLKIVLMFTGEMSPPQPSSPGPSSGSGPSTPTRGAGARQRSSPDLFIKPGELPTLFGSTKTKSEVVALVLLSGNNVNDGFGLAFRIIQDMKLDSTSIYAQVGTTLTRQHKYNFIKQLLGCMKDSGMCTDHNFDDVILPCIDVMILDGDQIQEAEAFIKLLRSDVNKINAYMRCGKLKSAYLLAVKTQRVEVVQRIEKDALRLNQPAVKSICKKWLQQHGFASLQ